MRKLILFFALSFTQGAECQWVQSYSNHDDVHCIGGVLGSILFAGSYPDVSGNSPFIISFDSGASWVRGDSGLINYSTHIYAFASLGQYLFAASDSGIYRSADTGKTWSSINNGLTNTFIWSFFVKDSILYAGVFGSGIFKSNDSGMTWNEANTGIEDTNIVIFNFVTMGSYIFAAGDTSIYRSSDNGKQWTTIISNTTGLSYSEWRLVRFENVLLATETWSETAFLSYDSGATWKPVHIPTPPNYAGPVIEVLAANGSNIFAGYEDAVGGIILSTDSGKTWSEIGNMPRVNSLFIFRNFIFAGTNSSGVYRALLTDFIKQAVHSHPSNISKLTALSNPTTSSADFKFDALQEPTLFELFDALGRSVFRSSLPAGQASLHVDMQHYSAGMYFARLGGESVKVIKN